MSVREVEFLSKGETVRGDLYLPEGEGPFPVIVMAGLVLIVPFAPGAIRPNRVSDFGSGFRSRRLSRSVLFSFGPSHLS